MKDIANIVREIEEKRKELKSTKDTAQDKQEFFNGMADLLSHVSDYLVEELKHDNKVEITNFPAPVTEVKVSNFRGIFGLLESLLKTIKKFKLPEIFKVQGEVTVKNQVTIPEVKFPEPVKTVGVNALPGYIRDYLEKIAKKELRVDVKAPEVNIAAPQVNMDLSTLETGLSELKSAFEKINISPEVVVDMTEVANAVNKVQDTLFNLKFPVPSVKTDHIATESTLLALKNLVDQLQYSSNDLRVKVNQALPAGTNNIGDVDVLTLPDVPGVTVGTLYHGSNLDIDTSAEQITSTSQALKQGVTVKADAANTGIIYVGKSGVTAGTNASTDGFPLSKGESMFFPVTNLNILYAIASVENQKVYYAGV